MATKNLARTIIEGGRSSYNKSERNNSHRQERAQTRAYLARASVTEDGFEALPIKKRPKVYKMFSDKLGAPRRWLRSQVGRPWNAVRSEIFSRFDPRTLAGQHIIFDHLLQEVVVHGVHDRWHGWRTTLYVDRHGILREEKPRKRRRGPWTTCAVPIPSAVIEWAAGRRVAGEEGTYFWLVEAGSCQSCRGLTSCCCPVIKGIPRHGPHLHYRQGHRLDAADLKTWQTLDGAVKVKLWGPRKHYDPNRS